MGTSASISVCFRSSRMAGELGQQDRILLERQRPEQAVLLGGVGRGEPLEDHGGQPGVGAPIAGVGPAVTAVAAGPARRVGP